MNEHTHCVIVTFEACQVDRKNTILTRQEGKGIPLEEQLCTVTVTPESTPVKGCPHCVTVSGVQVGVEVGQQFEALQAWI